MMEAMEEIREIVERVSMGNTKTIDRETNFAKIGLDSMDMVELVAEVEDTFSIRIDSEDVFVSDVGDLLDYLKEAHGIQ